jgi:hypothetical protein
MCPYKVQFVLTYFVSLYVCLFDHETAICSDPPVCNFTGDRKNVTDSNR